MASRIVKNKNATLKILNSVRVVTDIQQRTAMMTSTNNGQSSWGGYKSEVNTTDYPVPVGRIWSIGRSDSPGSDRALRLLRNLESGF